MQTSIVRPKDDYKVIRQSTVHWDVRGATEGALELLPAMSPDLLLERDDHVIVVDTKFYKNTLQASSYRETFHSSNIY